MAAFFDPGVRANTTSVNAAMQCGSVVITNLDHYSPSSFLYLDNVLDIRQCSALSTDRHLLSRICAKARATAAHTLGWDGLIARLTREEMTIPPGEQTHR